MGRSVGLSRTLRMTTAPGPPLPSSGRSTAITDNHQAKTPLEDVILAAQLPVGVTRDMADWFIVSAERAGEKLRNEATKSTPWPRELVDQPSRPSKDAPNIIFLGRDNGINLFERVAQPPAHTVRSLWDKMIRPRRRPRESPPAKPTPRVFGTTHVYASLAQLVALLGPRSLQSASLIHPDASLMFHVHTLLELGREHACLRTIGIPTPPEPRDFLVVEYRSEFQLPTDGRKGFVVAYHSVSWSGSPSATLPRAVRGSAYTSGLVALESETVTGRLELYGVAEINLKGPATSRDNAAFARERVELMLSRTIAAVEQTTLAALALDDERVFEIARRTSVHRQLEECVTCERTSGQLDGGRVRACRKCYAPVCGECCRAWRYGRQELRVCVACWHKANAAIGVS